MVEGFWIVQYEGLKDHGGGVTVFIRGSVLGGDSGTTYIGTYQTDEKIIKARINIHNFLAGGASFHTTSTHAFDFPGAPSFAPLFHAKGGGLDARSPTTSTNHTP